MESINLGGSNSSLILLENCSELKGLNPSAGLPELRLKRREILSLKLRFPFLHFYIYQFRASDWRSRHK